MIMDKYILRGKEPVKFEGGTDDWGKQALESNRHVDETFIDDYRISTVFLALDHQWEDNGPPLLFETMVFKGERGDLYMERYSTWDEAEAGHAKAVEMVKNGEIK